jgi:hypothetical protein
LRGGVPAAGGAPIKKTQDDNNIIIAYCEF